MVGVDSVPIIELVPGFKSSHDVVFSLLYVLFQVLKLANQQVKCLVVDFWPPSLCILAFEL